LGLVEARILTIGWDAAAGMFDDSVLRGYLANRELLRAEPQFFVQGGRPYWAVYVETRVLGGADAAGSPGEPSERPGSAGDAVFAALLSELDEVERARYQRILDWRREASRREGVPHYVLCTNRQAVDLARRAPRTLQALEAIKAGSRGVRRMGGSNTAPVDQGVSSSCSPFGGAAFTNVPGSQRTRTAGNAVPAFCARST
jgi:hypothetical protein